MYRAQEKRRAANLNKRFNTQLQRLKEDRQTLTSEFLQGQTLYKSTEDRNKHYLNKLSELGELLSKINIYRANEDANLNQVQKAALNTLEHKVMFDIDRAAAYIKT